MTLKQANKQSVGWSPRTGQQCGCRPGIYRDNCPACEGTGWMIDFRAIHERRKANESNNH